MSKKINIEFKDGGGSSKLLHALKNASWIEHILIEVIQGFYAIKLTELINAGEYERITSLEWLSELAWALTDSIDANR